MPLKTSQLFFFELNIPIKPIDFSRPIKYCTAITTNFKRMMEIGKAITTAATAWLPCIIQPQRISHFYKNYFVFCPISFSSSLWSTVFFFIYKLSKFLLSLFFFVPALNIFCLFVSKSSVSLHVFKKFFTKERSRLRSDYVHIA